VGYSGRVNTNTYRTAFITGASSGLGHGLTRWFSARGVKVYAAARRLEQLEALAEQCRRDGGQVEPVALDVSDPDRTLQVMRELDDASGGFDLVIANAGIGPVTNARRLDWADVDQTIRVNVLGAAATLSAVLPQMVKRGRGHLVGMSSLAGFRGLPKSAAYSASKAFLTTYLEGLRVDLRKTPVKVTVLNPGFIRTELSTKHKAERPFMMELDEAVDRMAQAIVQGDPVLSFPWALAAPLWLGKLLPARMWDAAAKRLG
jgi:short-subunit dehydrogenase